MPVLDKKNGESMEYSQLCRHPKCKYGWNTSYYNELGRLFQGVGSGTSGTQNQLVKGTYTFMFIKFDEIPQDRWKEICHTSVLCELIPNKYNPNRTHITVSGTRTCYPGDFATPTGSLELLKLIINTVLSRPGKKFD